eukprot:3438267-Alexandrium_andersonii.AAC.1
MVVQPPGRQPPSIVRRQEGYRKEACSDAPDPFNRHAPRLLGACMAATTRRAGEAPVLRLSLIHISEPTRLALI